MHHTGGQGACSTLSGGGSSDALLQSKAALDSLNTMMHLPVERPPGKFICTPTRFQGGSNSRMFLSVIRGKPFLPCTMCRSDRSWRACRDHWPHRHRQDHDRKTHPRLYHPTSGAVLVDGVIWSRSTPRSCAATLAMCPRMWCCSMAASRRTSSWARLMWAMAPCCGRRKSPGCPISSTVTRSASTCWLASVGRLVRRAKQTIAIARAQLLDPPILIMDEPGNSIDNRSEEIFKSRLEKTLEHKTLILVTHRATLLSLINRLIVIDGVQWLRMGRKTRYWLR